MMKSTLVAFKTIQLAIQARGAHVGFTMMNNLRLQDFCNKMRKKIHFASRRRYSFVKFQTRSLFGTSDLCMCSNII